MNMEAGWQYGGRTLETVCFKLPPSIAVRSGGKWPEPADKL